MNRNASFQFTGILAGVVASLLLLQQTGLSNGQAQQVQPPAQAKSAPPAQPVIPLQNFNNGTIPAVGWYNDPGVQKQLNLTTNQVVNLDKLYADAYNRNKIDPVTYGKMNPEQRAQKTRELWNNFNTQFAGSVQSTLNPQQYERFQQLQFQHAGLGVINHPTVEQKLDLTPTQRERLRAHVEEQQQKLVELQKTYLANPKGTTQEFDNLRRQNYQFLESLLTEQQRQTWRSLTGDPYSFAPEWYLKK